jgi:hypothetical protein
MDNVQNCDSYKTIVTNLRIFKINFNVIFSTKSKSPKVNEELFLENPLHVTLNKSKLAYRIYVILIANKELIKNIKKRPFP